MSHSTEAMGDRVWVTFVDLASSNSETAAIVLGSSIDLTPSKSEEMLTTAASIDLTLTEAQEELSPAHEAGGNFIDLTVGEP